MPSTWHDACLPQRESTHCQKCRAPPLQQPPPPASFSQLRKPEEKWPVLGHTSANRGRERDGSHHPSMAPTPAAFPQQERRKSGEGEKTQRESWAGCSGAGGLLESGASVVLRVGAVGPALHGWRGGFHPPELGTSCPAHVGPGPGGASASGSAPWEAGLLNKSRTEALLLIRLVSHDTSSPHTATA